MRYSSAVIITVIGSALAGCALEREIAERIEADQAVPDTLRSVSQNPPPSVQRTRNLQEVRLPLGGEWLGEPMSIALRDIDAKSAIQVLVGNTPVVFRLSDQATEITVKESRNAHSIKDHLDAVSLQANWAWSFSNGVIVVTDTVTTEVPLRVSPGRRTFSMNTDSLLDTNAVDGANVLLGGSNPYDALREALRSVGFSQGEIFNNGPAAPPQNTFAIMDYASVVILTGRPNTVRAGTAVIERFNQGHTARAIFEITIFEIKFRDGSDRRLDLNLLRATANELGLRIDPAETLSSLGSAGLSMQWNRPGDRLLGSTATLRWLNEHGSTSTRLHRRIELTNNELVTVRNLTVVPYVREVSQNEFSSFGGVNGSTEVVIENSNTGFALNVLPTIDLEQREVTLRINLSQASIVDTFTYSYDDDSVAGEIPIIKQQDDVITVSLRDQEAKLVTSATLTARSSLQATTPFLPLLGDTAVSSENRADFVMLVSVVLP